MQGKDRKMLEVKNMTFSYGERVWRVSFSLARGEIAQLIGESGSGKTTILQSLAGFHPSCGGDIVIEGHSIDALPSRQRPTACLFYENVALACDEKELGACKALSPIVESAPSTSCRSSL